MLEENKCATCGAKEKSSGNSLHCWDIVYECGSELWGTIGTDEIHITTTCPNKTI